MKKQWTTPEMTCLNVEETNSGGNGNVGDNDVFVFGEDLTFYPS